MKLSKTTLRMAEAAAVLLALTLVFHRLFRASGAGAFLSLYITFLTVFYHFAMRIAVGGIVALCFRNREFRYEAAWYRQSQWEKRLYDQIGIRKWKKKTITANPEQFDLRRCTYEELLHSMTQAEVVHEIIMLLSFAPMGLIPLYGEPAVFFLTSAAACCVDATFVMIQRFNRPRLLKLKKKLSRTSDNI